MARGHRRDRPGWDPPAPGRFPRRERGRAVAADAKDRSAVDLARALFARLARDRTDLAKMLLPILESLEPRRHGPDFASVAWDGACHTFTPTQARVVAILWAARDNGTPAVRQAYLLTESESDAER